MRSLKIVPPTKASNRLIANYFTNMDNGSLFNIGLDCDKIPLKLELIRALDDQLEKPSNQLNSLILIWELDDIQIGHTNLTPFKIAKYGNIHFHIWSQSNINQGYGKEFLKLSLNYFFSQFELEIIYSEPFSLNLVANNLLESVGFAFEKEYATIPGDWSFYQNVKRWSFMRKRIFK